MPSSGIIKYHVRLSYNVDGLVGRTDIIGAIFGQTEGLLGPDMNLNELQKISKIGRIDVTTKTTAHATTGEVLIPMSTDIDTCSLVAAALESIDKVGAFDSKFKMLSIDDIRAAKKDDIVKRAKEIKRKFAIKAVSDGDTMRRDVHEGTTANSRVSSYGPSKLPCGSGMLDSPWIILVEGRADIVNLIRAGYDNTLAIDGARVDESIKVACRSKKKIVAFLDGDRTGGGLMRELRMMVRVDVELRADDGVEVEELTPQRVAEILDPAVAEIKEEFAGHVPQRREGGRNGRRGRDRDRGRGRDRDRDRERDVERRDVPPPAPREEDKPLIALVTPMYQGLKETLEAVALDADGGEAFRAPVSELVTRLKAQGGGVQCIVMDGIITSRLIDAAKGTGVETIVGNRTAHVDDDQGLRLRSFSELGVF
ncbi:MAG: DNA primase DnaG [Thaumarchaeota archaeon]|nr:DNA primase DnaG [Nitrososphaerota archaeon]